MCRTAQDPQALPRLSGRSRAPAPEMPHHGPVSGSLCRTSPLPFSPEQSSVLVAWEVVGGLGEADCPLRQSGGTSLSGARRRSQAGTGRCSSCLCTSRTMRMVSARLNTSRAMHTTKYTPAQPRAGRRGHTGGGMGPAPRHARLCPERALPMRGVPMAVAGSVSDTMIRKTE